MYGLQNDAQLSSVILSDAYDLELRVRIPTASVQHPTRVKDAIVCRCARTVGLDEADVVVEVRVDVESVVLIELLVLVLVLVLVVVVLRDVEVEVEEVDVEVEVLDVLVEDVEVEVDVLDVVVTDIRLSPVPVVDVDVVEDEPGML